MQKGLPVQQTVAFRSLDMGECTGMTYDETRAAIGANDWEEVLSGPKADKRYFKSGESLSELARRSWIELERLIAACGSNDSTVVIGTHEEVIGALLCKMTALPLSRLWWWGGRLRPPLYASITEVLWKNGQWTLVHFGCTKHLEAP